MEVYDAHIHYGDSEVMRHITETSPLKTTFPCYRTAQFTHMADYPSWLARHGVVGASLLPSVFREHDKLLENQRVMNFASTYAGMTPFILLDEENPSFIDEYYKEIAGVKEHIVLHESFLTPTKREIFERLQKYGLILVLHSQAGRREEYVREILENFPRMKIQIAHMSRDGSRDPAFIYRSLFAFARMENVFFDTSTTRLPEIIENAVKIVGAERILFGSDFPFFMDRDGTEDIIQEQIFQILSARVSDNVKERIFSGNYKTYIAKGT
jgi:predicted TIM-barrel fold metal-dependent hydrolase